MFSVNFFIQRSELRDIYDKVVAGERISEADALRLFESKDLTYQNFHARNPDDPS